MGDNAIVSTVAVLGSGVGGSSELGRSVHAELTADRPYCPGRDLSMARNSTGRASRPAPLGVVGALADAPAACRTEVAFNVAVLHRQAIIRSPAGSELTDGEDERFVVVDRGAAGELIVGREHSAKCVDDVLARLFSSAPLADGAGDLRDRREDPAIAGVLEVDCQLQGRFHESQARGRSKPFDGERVNSVSRTMSRTQQF